MTDATRRALIVGASRGLGAGLTTELASRGWSVTATVRDPARGVPDGAHAVETVDIDAAAAVDALHARLAATRFDLIFVVAGVASDDPGRPIHEEDEQTALRIYRTNALSPIRFAERFVDLLAPDGMMALMSSTLGSVSGNTTGGWDSYRASKAALNMLARSFAARHEGLGVLIVHPGWVRTDMGGPSADLDVPTSARGMADMLDARRFTRGAVYVDWENQEVAW